MIDALQAELGKLEVVPDELGASRVERGARRTRVGAIQLSKPT